jgi:hypothetical protein
MWWRILVALVVTLPPVAYVAGALANDEQHREPHPTVVLNTGETEADRDGGNRDGANRDRPDRGEDKDRQREKRDRTGDGPGGVTVVRPQPMAVGDDGGDDDQDDGDNGDDDTDDTDDDDTDDD